MQDLREQMFAASQVADAADLTMSTLQNWLKRGIIIGQGKIQGGGERGRHRRFTWFNVMEICTVASLARAGLASDLSVAFGAGMTFGHTTSVLPGEPPREVGFPHHTNDGRSLLILTGSRASVVSWTPGRDVLSVARSPLGSPEAWAMVDLADMFERACGRLQIRPLEALDAAYGRGAVE